MDKREVASFRATGGGEQEFGATPQEALNALMTRLAGKATTPIIIWPYNLGDAFFSQTQQERLQDLKRRKETLTEAERQEWTHLVEAAFDATVSRTQSLPIVKS